MLEIILLIWLVLGLSFSLVILHGDRNESITFGGIIGTMVVSTYLMPIILVIIVYLAISKQLFEDEYLG